MSNAIGHTVLNLTLTAGIFGCLHHVDPYFAYAIGIYWVRELHAMSIIDKLREAAKKTE